MCSVICMHCKANLLLTLYAQVPPVFLKQLTSDKEIFKELPAKCVDVNACPVLTPLYAIEISIMP